MVEYIDNIFTSGYVNPYVILLFTIYSYICIILGKIIINYANDIFSIIYHILCNIYDIFMIIFSNGTYPQLFE